MKTKLGKLMVALGLVLMFLHSFAPQVKAGVFEKEVIEFCPIMTVDEEGCPVIVYASHIDCGPRAFSICFPTACRVMGNEQ